MRFIRNLFIAAALLSWWGLRPAEALIGGALPAIALKLILRPRKRLAVDFLEQVLFWWSPKDAFTYRDLCQSVVIIGQTGSGKTSGSGLAVSRALAGCGLVILASKPEDRDYWLRRAAEAGKKLYIFAEDTDLTTNMIDVQSKNGVDPLSLTKFVSVLSETIEGKEKGQDREPFWESGKERVIYNTIVVIKLALGQVSAPAMLEFLATAAGSLKQLQAEEWRQTFHAKVLYAASKNVRSTRDKNDYELAKKFWMHEYPTMNDRTRTSIIAVVMNTLHVLNIGMVREKISGETNFSPEQLLKGAWLLVDYPVSRYDASGKAIMGAWKFVVQRDLLRRSAGPNDPPVIIWSDECQNLINSHDARFLAECRSHRGGMVFLTQSLHSFYGAMDKHHHQAEALLTNFTTKIFHTIGDAKTAEWASSLLGNQKETLGGGSYDPDNRGFRGSFSSDYKPTLQPVEFMSGMRSSGGVVDGILVRSGLPFNESGQNYLRVSFSQE